MRTPERVVTVLRTGLTEIRVRDQTRLGLLTHGSPNTGSQVRSL
jgi:hypothetical protein